jgi:hypothetical protein
MKTVTFSFARTVPSNRQAEILEQLEAVRGVAAARKVKPDSPSEVVSRMAYVRASDDIDVDDVIRRLAESSEIDTPPTLPAKRRLVRR